MAFNMPVWILKNKFCFCMSLQKGALLVGLCVLVLNVAYISYTGYLVSITHGLLRLFSLAITIPSSLGMMFLTGVMMKGVQRKKPGLMLHWIHWAPVIFLINGILVGVTGFDEFNSLARKLQTFGNEVPFLKIYFAIFFPCIGLMIYFWLVVFFCRKELLVEEEETQLPPPYSKLREENTVTVIIPNTSENNNRQDSTAGKEENRDLPPYSELRDENDLTIPASDLNDRQDSTVHKDENQLVTPSVFETVNG